MNMLFQMIVLRLGWVLIHSLWQGMLVAAVLVLVLRVMSDGQARVRYFASCVALAVVLCSAIVTYCLLDVKVQKLVTIERPVAMPTAHAAVAAPSALPPVVSPSFSKGMNHDQMLRLLVLAWGLGVVLVSAWHLFGWVSLWRLSHGERMLALEPTLVRLRRQLKIRRIVRLIETTRLNVPAVVGAFRPIILLPIGLMSELTPQQIEAILLHELAHIARHDYLVNLLQAAIEALMFYHPAVWWISSQIRREREHCCDDAAAGCCNTRIYAETLLALEQRRMPTGMLALGVTDGVLLSRVRRLLKVRSGPTHRPVRLLATALLLLGCLGLPFVAVAQQKPPAAPVTRPIADQDSNSASKLDFSEILPDDLKVVKEEYRIGSKDLLKISLENLLEKGVTTEKATRVNDAGMVSLPLMGEIKVGGRTCSEAEQAIAKAYADAKEGALLRVGKDLHVSLVIDEMRNRNFSILGQVDQPGQYAIFSSELRLSSALAWATPHAHLKDDLFLTVIRAAPAGQKHRAINIPIAKLYAGDPAVNVVIRSGDLILATLDPIMDQQGGQPTTAPVKADAETGEYYIAGQVQRSGVYSFGTRKVTVKQAIISAGVESETNNAYVTVIRRSRSSRDDELFVLKNARYHDLSSANQGDTYIEDNDMIRVDETPVKSRYNAKEVADGIGDNEYYIGGEVQRVGVYSLARRKVNILQAMMSAGGPVSEVYVSVLRRPEKGEEFSVLLNARIEDLSSGDQPEVYLEANDIVMVSKHPERVAATQAAPLPVRATATTQGMILPAPTKGTEPGRDFVFRANGNSLVVSLPDGKTFVRDRYTVKKEDEKDGGAETTFTAVDGVVELRVGGVLTLRGTELHYGPKGASVAATQPAR